MNEFQISLHTGPPSDENMVATIKLSHPITFNMSDDSVETITSISLWDGVHPNETDAFTCDNVED